MPELFKNKYRIPSARLQTWDYADNAMYFITICTANRECFFGDVVETQCIASLTNIAEYEMQLSDLGKTVESEWLKTKELRQDMNLELDEYVVMPNHFHGILFVDDNRYNIREYTAGRDALHREAMHCVSTHSVSATGDVIPKNKFGPQTKNLASIIRGFKSSVTTYARKNNIPFDWQARFHEHIITSNSGYLRIADYITNNVKNWRKDKFYKK